MPHLTITPSEIRLFYQIYGEKNPKPQGLVLFDLSMDQKFAQDIIDDLVSKELWDEVLETQLEDKQLYFKVFREDEDIIPLGAIEFDNVRLLPNRGLLDLEESLQNTLTHSVNWFSSFIPEGIKQSAFNFGNQLAEWAEDKLTGLSAYSSIPKVEQIDEEVWQEILEKNAEPTKTTRNNIEEENSDQSISTVSTSYFNFTLNTVWNCAAYAINHPFQALTLMLATQALLLRSAPTTRHSSKFASLKPTDNYKAENNFFFFPTLPTLVAQTTFAYGTNFMLNGRQHVTISFAFLNLASLFSSAAAQPWHTIYPTPYDLANSNSQGGVKFLGDTSAVAGYSVSAVGDVNGDGKPDFLIGTYGNSAYLIYGGPWLNTPTFSLSNLDGTNGVKFLGVSQGDYTGRYVSAAGDVNGDGTPDFLISAQGANNQAGAVYLIYGGSWLNTPTFSLANLNSASGVIFLGVSAYDYIGSSVSSAGDVNGDGKSDFLIGAPNVNNRAGAAYLIYGGSWLNNMASFSLANLNGVNGVKFSGDYNTGLSISAAGDVNGDGKSDFFIGAISTGGIVYLIYSGSWLNTPTFALTSLNSTTGIKFLGSGDNSGSSVSGVGDVNGDGRPDFLIGASSANNFVGAVYLIYGGSWLNTPTFSLASLNGITGVKLLGISAGDNTGSSVSAAGDINGDGKPDFLIGAPGAGGGGTSLLPGIAYLVYGGSWLNTPTFSLANLNSSTGVKFIGGLINGYGDRMGISVSAAGDVNGDGTMDFLIGSMANSVYLINGFGFVLQRNALNLSRADTVLVNSAFLNSGGMNPANLILSPNNVQHGRFELISTGQAITSFTQQQINQGLIQFVHDGGSVVPSYTISVSANNSPATIAPVTVQVTFYKNPPILLDNNLLLNRAQKVLFTSAQLNSRGTPSYWPASTTFTIDNLQYGHFENILHLGQAITLFTQLQLNQGQVQFVHDGSAFPPGYTVKLSDPGLMLSPEAAQITFIQNPPVLLTNTLAIKQGQSVILSNKQLNSLSMAYPDSGSRTITVSNIQHGHFEFVMQGVVTFTQQQIDRGYIQFVHDGSCSAPAYMAILSDPGMTLQPAQVQISFELLIRSLDTNRLTIKQGETLTLEPTQLSANGFSSADTQNLQFIITAPLHIHFSSLSFLQQEITLGKLKVTHDGSTLAPSYNVSIVNCGHTYGPWSASVIFYPTILPIPSPTTTSGPNESVVIDNALIGGLISGGVGLVFFILKFYLDYAVKKRLKKTMENSDALDPDRAAFHRNVIIPVAERIFSVVKISGILSNSSEERMNEYRDAIIRLVDCLRETGVNIDLNMMDSLKQSAFLSIVARQTKNHVVPNVGCCSTQYIARFFVAHASPQDILDKNQAIAQAVKQDLDNAYAKEAIERQSDPTHHDGMSMPLLSLPRA